MDSPNSNSKKAKRIESKKKKAAAFLALVRSSKPKMLDTPDNETTNNETANPALENETANPAIENKPVNEDVLLEMKKLIRERKKLATNKPKVYLTLENTIHFRAIPEQPVREEELPPLYALDLQQLLLYGLQGNSASYKPRWCKLLRVGKVSSVVLLLLEGVSINDYQNNKRHFPFISERFVSYVEMVSPKQYNKTLDSELFNVPLSVSQLKKANVKVPENIRKKVAQKIAQPVSKAATEKFSRTCLLLSTYQMMREGYPLPVHTNVGRYQHFVFTKDKYATVTPDSPLFALDCEMCTTTAMKNELTRVSIVSESGEVIYDTLVKPKNRIINYLTRFSGITKQMLDPVETTIEDVQREIKKLLPPDAILCGQSLNGDLMALQMFHPYVIDTSIIFNMSGIRGVKAGLRKLSQFFLGRIIQNSKQGHNSCEDATATLDLVKLKLTKGLEFGDATLSGVYFPDIHTYFSASENSKAGVVQNVEKEDTQPVLSKTEASNRSACDLNVCKSSCQESHQMDKKEDAFAQKNLKRNSSAISDSVQGIQSQKRSSSSSSDSDESESSERNASHDNDLPPAKKRKVTDNSNNNSENHESLPANSATENPQTDIPDLHYRSGKLTECKDFSFTSTAGRLEQLSQCLFNQNNSVHISRSFFSLAYEAGRSGCLIDRKVVTDKYKTEPIETVMVTNDKEVRKTAKIMVQSKEFLWANFREYSDEMEHAAPLRKEKLMRKLDNRVKSVMNHVSENALVVVVMTGRESDHIPQNMATFMTIT